VGQGGRLFSWGHSALPRLYDRLAPHAMQLVALGEETEKGPGNVFERNPEWNRVSGEWRIDRRKLAFGVLGGFFALGSVAAEVRRAFRARR
jgi:hypothetical protein